MGVTQFPGSDGMGGVPGSGGQWVLTSAPCTRLCLLLMALPANVPESRTGEQELAPGVGRSWSAGTD